ncbi:hypothetical protein ERO13_A10G213766v2 [Gossypium hirsutum]|nr:hypothetical protein ERO13_A10G213766v2 [Gossypium hirsutum]
MKVVPQFEMLLKSRSPAQRSANKISIFLAVKSLPLRDAVILCICPLSRSIWLHLACHNYCDQSAHLIKLI